MMVAGLQHIHNNTASDVRRPSVSWIGCIWLSKVECILGSPAVRGQAASGQHKEQLRTRLEPPKNLGIGRSLSQWLEHSNLPELRPYCMFTKASPTRP